MSIAQRIGQFFEGLTRREPSELMPDEPSDFACAKCSDTGWVLCKCSDPCTCENYGELRCPKGCAEQ